MFRTVCVMAVLVLGVSQAEADAIGVPYSGSFDEASVVAEGGLPAGDFDTIGGLEDVGLFSLTLGANTFTGSIYSPNDPSDVFLIEVAPGLSLVGAEINWGTNLPGIALTFPPDPEYRDQNTFGPSAPDWVVEESSTVPELFRISDLEGSNFGTAPSTRSVTGLGIGPGIYSSALLASGTCMQAYSTVDVGGQTGLQADCVDGIDYTMTFTTASSTPSTDIPTPQTAIMLAVALALLGFASARRKDC